MRKSIFTSILLLSFPALSIAQHTVVSSNSSAFNEDQQRNVLRFRLPQNAYVHDLIYITTEKGVVVKKYEIDKAIVAAGTFAFQTDSIPTGTYLVTVASNSMIKYQFRFNNKGKITTVTLKDGKLSDNGSITKSKTTATDYKPAAPAVAETPAIAETVALTFDAKRKEFIVSSGIPFRAGTKIEVFNVNHTLIATRDVTEEMVSAKQYIIKVDELQPGTYFVNVDDVKFGGVTYPD